MKKLIIALLVFLVMILAGAAEIVYTTNSFKHLALLTEQANNSMVICSEYKKQEEQIMQAANRKTASEAENNLSAADVRALLDGAENEAEERLKTLEEYWQRHKNVALILGNHTVVKAVDERIISLRQQTDISAWEDACVMSAVLKAYFEDLKDDNHITLSNLF